MTEIKNVYRLRQLIYQKYGEERFAIACDIVARWVRYDTKFSQWHADTVLQMCNATGEEFPLSSDEAFVPQQTTFTAKNFAI